ncbi:MAG TPA: amidohydrolase family protein [Sedimentisphaerales bacterium]|nr:amidohydrolase family protein [Sedimentisphaerales bacterium]
MRIIVSCAIYVNSSAAAIALLKRTHKLRSSFSVRFYAWKSDMTGNKGNSTGKKAISRRLTLKSIGAVGAAALWPSKTSNAMQAPLKDEDFSTAGRRTIYEKVCRTPFIDTHEHLPDESQRLAGVPAARVGANDWSVVLGHYLNCDMIAAGMPLKQYNKFFSKDTDPVEKWKLLEPYWPAVKNTGYGQAVRIALKQLYDVDELSSKTVQKVQSGYEQLCRPGFYKYILCDLANIESCQVNCVTGSAFRKSDQPTFLMQDLSVLGMLSGGGDIKTFAGETGIEVTCLSDWHKVIDWWFDKYGQYAVAVKSQHAYRRDIDHEKVPAEQVETSFKKKLAGETLSASELKLLEDHLFWYVVRKATKMNLPVKLHTGYYTGNSRMPLSRLVKNCGSATQLCLDAPQARFVFMHICYPYYEPLIAAAKHYPNAYIDMCWSWIINPAAAKDFLKKYIVTAPLNKILTFGGDYIPVEPVLGHAVIARKGIALALSELVEEGWLSLDDAMETIEPVMNGNARQIFNLSEKEKILKKAPWA